MARTRALVRGVRSLAAAVLRGWLHVYHRLTIVGRQNLPEDRSFVLVANHGSHLDAVALACALPVRQWNHAYAAAAQDYFFRGIFKSFVAVVNPGERPAWLTVNARVPAGVAGSHSSAIQPP